MTLARETPVVPGRRPCGPEPCVMNVHRHGLHLVPAMCEHINPVQTRERAEEIERVLTDHLRRHGFGVWSN